MLTGPPEGFESTNAIEMMTTTTTIPNFQSVDVSVMAVLVMYQSALPGSQTGDTCSYILKCLIMFWDLCRLKFFS